MNSSYKLFKVSPNNKVIIGKDNWFFYTRDNNLALGLGTYTLSDDELDKITQKQNTIQKGLRNIGSEYVIVLVPSKVSVYPELIGGRLAGTKTMIDEVEHFLLKNTSIPVINTKPVLINAKANNPVYFKEDTHWNDEGIYTAYKSILEKFNQIGMVNTNPTEIITTDNDHVGDLTRLMGLVDKTPPERYKSIGIVNADAVEIDGGKEFDTFSEQVQNYYGNEEFHFFQNQSVDSMSVLVFGDSCLKLKLIQLLAENFSEVYFVSSNNLKVDFVYKLQPDVVILEVTERLFEGVLN